MKFQNIYVAGCGLLLAAAGYMSLSLCGVPKPNSATMIDSPAIDRSPVQTSQTLDGFVSNDVDVQDLVRSVNPVEGDSGRRERPTDLPQNVQDGVERFIDSFGINSFQECGEELRRVHRQSLVDFSRAQDDLVVYERMLQYRNADTVFHMLNHTSNVPWGQRVRGYYGVFSVDEQFSPFLDDAVAALLARWGEDDARELVEFYEYVCDQNDAKTAGRVLDRMVEVIDQGPQRDSPYHIAGWYELLQGHEGVRYDLPFVSRQIVIFRRLDWAQEQLDAQVAFIDEQLRRAPSGDVGSYEEGPSTYRPYGTNEIEDPQAILENHAQWRARARTYFEDHCERIRNWDD